jgi:hypothetical protein
VTGSGGQDPTHAALVDGFSQLSGQSFRTVEEARKGHLEGVAARQIPSDRHDLPGPEPRALRPAPRRGITNEPPRRRQPSRGLVWYFRLPRPTCRQANRPRRSTKDPHPRGGGFCARWLF